MAYTTIISTDTLDLFLGDNHWAIVDCRFKLDDPEWGDLAFRAGHIPGAAYAHLDRDLSGTKTGANGRHPLPHPDELAETFGQLGIERGLQVVAYDQDNGMFASRLWFLLRWMGHDQVAVLDGGLAKWLAERRPVERGPSRRPSRTFVGLPRPELVAGLEEVSAVSESASARRLVDARAPERYRGDVETVDRVAGHIPGATNHFFQKNVRQDGTFRDKAEIAGLWKEALAGTRADEAIHYCGSGVTACQNLLAMEHADLHGGRLYPGSWSEWSADPSRPVETSGSKPVA